MKMRDRTGRITADVADEAVGRYEADGWRAVGQPKPARAKSPRKAPAKKAAAKKATAED